MKEKKTLLTRIDRIFGKEESIHETEIAVHRGREEEKKTIEPWNETNSRLLFLEEKNIF